MNKKNIIIGVILAVLIVVGSFYGGMKYGQSHRSLAQGNFSNMQRRGAGSQAGNFVTGQIINQDAQSITVKLNNGGSKIVFFSDNTKVSKTADGTLSDLQAGEGVTVTGTTNPDGSVTAQSIQIRPVSVSQPGAQPNQPNNPAQ
jgi:hypothetical protein